MIRELATCYKKFIAQQHIRSKRMISYTPTGPPCTLVRQRSQTARYLTKNLSQFGKKLKKLRQIVTNQNVIAGYQRSYFTEIQSSCNQKA